ncbi:MAG TPA: TonB family protein [Candidatus Angelobacter sp.]|nr:TonB family protein [Candidatus Angelobacter sp.]
MQSAKKAISSEAFPASDARLRFVLEPEPWLLIFTRNIGDLFRKGPPPVWISAAPGEYWPDALVHRPAAWKAARQSFLGHALVIVAIYALNLAWLNQPQVLPQTSPNQTVVHYEVSEYLPPVNTRKAKPEPPRRARPQKADPEFAPQEIVVTNENHISTRQTIVQPSAVILKQDIPLPNLVASTTVPGAPMAMNHPMQALPVNVPQIAEPSQPVAQSKLRPLLFPPAAQPEVAAPAGTAASHRAMPSLPLYNDSVIVVPPAPDVAARRPNALQLPAQAPSQIAEPAPQAASSHALQSIPMAMAAPQVVAPAPATASRNLGNLGLPSSQTAAVPPASAVVNGNSAREKALGQILVLNAQPVAPSGPLVVPEGNRPGEFAASPSGHSGASARPEIAQRNSSNNGSPADIYVAAPPSKVTGNAAADARRAVRPLTPDKTEPSRDSVDTRIFGTRRHYSMRLSMPNLASSTGSWSIRFAELNATHGGADLSAPEAITKVDPAYPQDLMHDRVEGMVILYAVIRADGSVGEVKVLEGFDDRLNENARKALEQWHFRPGTKDGTPVDIEAVVRVPFKVPRSSF